MRPKFPRCQDDLPVFHRSPRSRLKDTGVCGCKSIDEISYESENEIVEEGKIDQRHLSSPAGPFDSITKPECEDIEISLFLQRIFNLLNPVMRKLELAAALESVIVDPDFFEIVNTTELIKLRDFVNLGLKASQPKIHFDDSSLSRPASEESETSSDKTCPPVDSTHSKLYSALQILDMDLRIREKVRESFRQGEVPLQAAYFLQHVKSFVEHCFRRMVKTPLKDKNQREYFRKLWHENHKAQRDIDALLSFLEEQRRTQRDLITEIAAQFKKDTEILEKLSGKCNEDMKAVVARSERKQITEHKFSELRLYDMRQYLAISKNKVENLRETYLRLEQEIRSKRFKVTSQLLSHISKFDTELGERYKNLEELVEQFQEHQNVKETLEEENEALSEVCSVFLRAIESARMAAFQLKLDNFMQNRAAKVIQRWWRPIFQRIKLKKKLKRRGKKGKKKKKKK